MGTTLDTNLCAGLHDTTSSVNNGFGPPARLTLAADGKFFTFAALDGIFTAFRQTRERSVRLSRKPECVIDFQGSTSVCIRASNCKLPQRLS